MLFLGFPDYVDKVLAQTTLLTELQRFADPAAPVFEAWPRSRDDARHRWAHALFVYASDMVDLTPVLTPTASSLAFTSVEAAFFTALSLDNATAEDAATDFTTAWAAAIQALLPSSTTVTLPGPTAFAFAAMNPLTVTARRTQLHAALVAAFRTPRSTRRADLSDIADAFHAATSQLDSTPTPSSVVYG